MPVTPLPGGPLAGTRVLELPALGPVPFAAMLLADLGADVVRVDRCDTVDLPSADPLDAVLTGRDDLARSRRRIAVDLRRPAAPRGGLARAGGPAAGGGRRGGARPGRTLRRAARGLPPRSRRAPGHRARGRQRAQPRPRLR